MIILITKDTKKAFFFQASSIKFSKKNVGIKLNFSKPSNNCTEIKK